MATAKMTLEYFKNKANTIHNNKYDYRLVESVSSRSYITIICPIHQEFTQRVSAHLNSQGCKKCRNLNIGNRFRSSKEKFVEDSNMIHNNKYNYDKFEYINDKVKGDIYCKQHNLEFKQTPSNHKKSKRGCPQCAKDLFRINKKNSLEKTIELCKNKHPNEIYDYSLFPSQPHSHDKVKIICKTCNNTFEQLLYSHNNIGNGCPICKISKDEMYIGQFIENELHIPITRSDYSVLENKQIDILIKSHHIGIEINGNYWHSELVSKKHRNYHLTKTKLAETKHIDLLQFFGDEITNKLDICKSIIRYKLKKSNNRIFARKCEIKEITDISEKNIFLDNNHIQGKDQSKIKIGLYYNNELVSLMTFGSARYNKKIQFELLRFCNKINTVVVGAASRLFNYFIKTYNPINIISYADKRISQGSIYEILNFKHTHDADPRYYYMHKNNYLKRYHRSNFTKDRIKKLYPDVDIINDEWNIMKSLGYDRIWDCGNKVYVWTNITNR